MSYVTKRNGQNEPVDFNKITERINKLINPIELQSIGYNTQDQETSYLDPIVVAQKVVASLYSGITTEELDIESAEICVNLSTTHPLYSYLGGRILVSNLHKKTLNNFSDKVELLKDTLDKDYYNYVMENKDIFNKLIDYNRDYVYDYFGFKTLEKSYLHKIIINDTTQIIERPQDMLLRVAITLQMGNLKQSFESIKKTYYAMSLGCYTHASPTLFNAGTKHMQLSSCFLKSVGDSLTSISKSWSDSAEISKWAGGLGIDFSHIRGKDSIIKGTNGRSDGLVRWLKIYNEIAKAVNQGGKRPGSFAAYLPCWHTDIFEFLLLRRNFGSEEERARDLFLALWVSDLFMKQLDSDGDWYLLSPDDCPGLSEVYGDEFESLYWKYVNSGLFRKKISARKLWTAILESQIETGMPYIGFKDNVNHKSNHKNIGVVKSSNLCIEIVQYSDDKEYAVCNLASIALNSCIKKFDYKNLKDVIIYSKPNCKYCEYAKNYLSSHNIGYKEIPFNQHNLDELKKKLGKDDVTFPQIFSGNDSFGIGGWNELYNMTAATYDYDKLYDIAYLATRNLNQVIDINYYPVKETKFSNMRHRPVGLGIQGLADTLVMLKIPFDSEKAVEFNNKYMEIIYLASVTASNDMAKERYEPMKQLIDSKLTFPEYYDKDFTVENNEMNTNYHMMKPCKWELELKSNYGSYSSFNGSLFSEGKFQFDMWNKSQFTLYSDKWEGLREDVMKYGVRNSMLTALMPTASTSQILGNNECFEFFTNNIYTRRTQAGSFVMVNKYLIQDLIHTKLWNKNLKDMIIANDGSIQSFDFIPPEFKNIYKTMWEIKQIWVLKGALARSPFVDQTQSMNIFMAEPDFQRLGSSHFWAWKNGLKTGIYYLRSKPASGAIKFTIDPNMIKAVKNEEDSGCETCSA